MQRRQLLALLATTAAAVLLPREPVWPDFSGGRRGEPRRSEAVGRAGGPVDGGRVGEAAAVAAQLASRFVR